MRQSHTVSAFPISTGRWISQALFLLALLLTLGVPFSAQAQSKKSLEEKRRKLISEIAVTDKLLKKTTQTREATYDRFIALQNQIDRREKLIETLGQEVSATQESIDQNAGVIDALNRDLGNMREEYGRLIRYAYRQKMLSNPLLFILSAASLNQAFRRWLFLRKYDQFRKEQAHMIAATQEMLARKISGLETKRKEKESLLENLKGQKNTLSQELSQKDKLLKVLTKDEDRLREDLTAKQKAHEALNQAIERIIQEDVRKQVEEARKPKIASSTGSASGSSSGKTNTGKAVPENALDNSKVLLTESFGKNRGRLPWPVESGFVSRGFGLQRHPTIKSVEITNNGIDIRTDEGSPVHAVFDGQVAGVQFIPGHDYTVILQHGEYYTVYSNLSETNLSKGDMVKSGQTLGHVSTNPITGTSELHFELWDQKERQDPSGWIHK